MSAAEQGDSETIPAAPGQSVLAQLPRTRPQRSSARRDAAREAGRAAKPAKPARARRKTAAKAATTGTRGAAKRTAKEGAAAAPARPAGRKPARKPPARARARTGGEEAVPPQGYASDGERLSGSVAPPGSAEFVATAAEILGELAKAGASGGERAVKGLLSRFRLS